MQLVILTSRTSKDKLTRWVYLSATPFILGNMGTTTQKRPANVRPSELSCPKRLIPNHGLHPVPSSRKREKQRLELLKLRKRWELLLIPQLGNSSRKSISPSISFGPDGRMIYFVPRWRPWSSVQDWFIPNELVLQSIRMPVCVTQLGHLHWRMAWLHGLFPFR